ncbi:hypothetical protein [Telmatospirillum sp. J64-1]|uniref:hypothetical protein n=1 Tax=Telmatospirillum sp. J64-1 TaxID=2502183 RepID=UPI00115F3C61|nr:hypothetical protein [Telmatospirillum sp. J64-1]
MARRPDPQQDEKLHKALRLAHDDRRLALYVDFDALNRQGSLVYNPWEYILPLLFLLLGSLALLLSMGMIIGLVAMFLAVLAHFFVINHLIAWRLRQRTIALAFGSVEGWKMMWERGGIAVALVHQPGISCLAPSGDWRRFAQTYLPDAEEYSRMNTPPPQQPPAPPPQMADRPKDEGQTNVEP